MKFTVNYKSSKKEWRPSKSYNDSDYVTNDKYVNGDYDYNNYIKYREDFNYDESKSEWFKRLLWV